MKKYLKMPWALRRATFLAMIPVFFLGGCGQKTECENSIDTAMGTVISQTVYVTGNSATTTNGKINEKITDVVLQKLNDLEQQELSWRLESAEVARINATAGEGTDTGICCDGRVAETMPADLGGDRWGF